MAANMEDTRLRTRLTDAITAAKERNIALSDVIGTPKGGEEPKFATYVEKLRKGKFADVATMLDLWDKKFAEYKARTRTPAAKVPVVAPLLQGVPVQKPESSEELQKRFKKIKELADDARVSVDQAAEAANLGLGKWDESALLVAINSRDENARRTASLLLNAWRDATNKRLELSKRLGGMPVKDAPPTKLARLREDSIEELRGIDGYEGGFITLHNHVRDKKRPLTYCHELALSAQAWADHLIKTDPKSDKHNTALKERGIGQSKYYVGGQRVPILKQLAETISDFLSERGSYDPQTEGSKNGMHIGHYTQLVWKSTTKVGCGLAGYKTKTEDYWRIVIVFDYSPAGNMPGDFKNNVRVPKKKSVPDTKGSVRDTHPLR